MILLNILEVISEHNTVKVISDETEKILAEYNGKDSIPEEYNDWIVAYLETQNNELLISIMK
jgi:hypothetical protein